MKMDEPELTPEQCRKFSESTQDLDPIARLTPSEAEMLVEEGSIKKLKYGSTDEAIRAMHRRLTDLIRQKSTALCSLDDCADHMRGPITEALDGINRKIAATKSRLAAYETQHEGRN